jgi:titin
LNIHNASREDTGSYHLIVENELGYDSATIPVNVVDVPDAPRFPQVENVLDDAVILSWKPPMNDGGSMITQYIVEKRDLPGGEWVVVTKTRFTYITIEGGTWATGI